MAHIDSVLTAVDAYLKISAVFATLLAAIYIYNVAIRRRRESAYNFKFATVLLIAVALSIAALTSSGVTDGPTVSVISILCGVGSAFVLVPKPKQSRRIPKRTKRAVAERDLKGEPFDPARHEFDHIVPYSKGGDNSTKNLRVLDRGQNRRRGNKMPKMEDFF